jgi:hypothetical protein
MVTGKRTNNDLQNTTQKTKDTKLVIRSCKSKDRQHNDHRKKTNNDLQNTTQKTKDIKLVIRSCKSKDRQYNGHRKKDKQWSIKHHTEN